MAINDDFSQEGFMVAYTMLLNGVNGIKLKAEVFWEFAREDNAMSDLVEAAEQAKRFEVLCCQNETLQNAITKIQQIRQQYKNLKIATHKEAINCLKNPSKEAMQKCNEALARLAQQMKIYNESLREYIQTLKDSTISLTDDTELKVGVFWEIEEEDSALLDLAIKVEQAHDECSQQGEMTQKTQGLLKKVLQTTKQVRASRKAFHKAELDCLKNPSKETTQKCSEALARFKNVMKTHSQNLQEYLVALTSLNNLYKETEKEKIEKT